MDLRLCCAECSPDSGCSYPGCDCTYPDNVCADIGSGCSSEDSGCSPPNGSCSTSVGGCFSLKRNLSGSTRVAEGATVGRRMAVRYVTWGAGGSSGARANHEGKEMLTKRAKAEGTEAALPLAEKS